MNVILWVKFMGSPFATQAINLLAHQYGALNFQGVVQDINLSPPPPPFS